MIATINQYIESLENPAGRFRTLKGVFPKRNTDGSVSLRTHRRYVDFDIETVSGDAVLRVPVWQDDALSQVRTLSARIRRLHSPNIAAFDFKPCEMTVFDSSGRAVQIDVCIQNLPPHRSLDVFLDFLSSRQMTKGLEGILARVSELLLWASHNGLGVAPSGIVVTQTEKGPVPLMVAVSKIDQSVQIIIAMLFAVLLPRLYKEYGRQILLHSYAMGRCSGQLSVRLRGTAYEEIAVLCGGCTAETFRQCVAKICAYTHEDFCRLGKLLIDGQPNFKDFDALPASNLGHAFSHYYWIDAGGEDILCVMDGEGWKYVDSDNRMVIPQTFRYAMPFREGRAEVETDSGKGLIDVRGQYVLPPHYEEMCWDEYNGIAIVMRYGKWSICNRDGKSVGKERFDYLGVCSEDLIVAMRDGKWGFVNLQGCVTIPLEYDDATSFVDGRAYVCKNGRSFTIGRSGKEIP